MLIKNSDMLTVALLQIDVKIIDNISYTVNGYLIAS